MQRLTLILSDLYLPEDGVSGGFPQTDELPALSRLLRFADGPEHIGDWRRWLLGRVGGQLAEIPLPKICAYGLISVAELETAWLATPVALEARLDHVRMVDRGLLYLEVHERAAWCGEFNRVFGPAFALHDGGERGFFLSGLTASTPIADPARLLGDEIGPALPGADVPELRRLWAEIEMWLHGSALNDARERAGRRRLSALWLWGRNTGSRDLPGIDERDVEFYGGDPLISGLSRMREPRQRGVPKALAHIEGTRQHVVAEFAPLTGHPHETLASIDANWFAAARQAIDRGELAILEIVANDRCFRITRRSQWRLWRRRRGWLETLAH
jgi:hypothetical protein